MIEDVPVLVMCAQCEDGVALPSVQSFVCPRHGLPATKVLQGKEIEIRSMECEV